ncbi:hypothetical protein AB0G79_17325 [Streptomyces sp. NPDC020807]|uniref:hypothetical protein n=1 Tax=Streptomyces sp. NPDC020807 TaxID=3155119 RepID=UPI0033D8F194
MRPAQDVTAGQSATPIFDALYAEYSRSFRTLPGDRSGEEEVPFRAFGTTASTGLYGSGTGSGNGIGGGYAAPPYGHGPAGGNGLGYRHSTAYQPMWTAPQHHAPAALPPGPRRGI